MGTELVHALRGATAMGSAIVSLIFLRYWRTSYDRLFLFFALGFAILALDYLVLAVVPVATEWRVYVFGVRLIAFGLILYGIYEKNRA
jgi:hypothetical protein